MQFKGALKHQWGTFTDTVNYLNYQRRVKTCSRSQGTTISLSARSRNSMAKNRFQRNYLHCKCLRD